MYVQITMANAGITPQAEPLPYLLSEIWFVRLLFYTVQKDALQFLSRHGAVVLFS